MDYNAIENREIYLDAIVKADAYLDYSNLRNLFDMILKSKDNLKIDENKISR